MMAEYLEILDKEEKLDNEIEEIYDKLMTLNISGLEESPEYRENLVLLSILNKMEQDITAQLHLSITQSLSLAQMLSLQNGIFHIDLLFDKIINEDFKYKTIYRIIHSLLTNSTIDENVIKTVMTKLNLEEVPVNDKEISIADELDTNLQFNINMAYLYYLDKMILRVNNNDDKKRLIISKYNTAYMYSELEEEMIKRQFNVTTLTETLFKNNRDYIGLYETIKEDGIKVNVDKLIKSILNISDFDYCIKDRGKAVTYLVIMLKANLSLLKEDVVEEINYNFNNYQNRENDFYFSKISREVVSEAFRNIRHEKVKKLIKND